MYIWQLENWPQFDWNEALLRHRLDRIRLLQGKLLGSAAVTGESIALEMEALIQNAIHTSEIEGENLDVASVRFSVARQLGINHSGLAGKATTETDAMASLLIEATHNWQSPVTLATLYQWQALVFPGEPEMTTSLRDEQPMHVMSGRQAGCCWRAPR